MNVAASEFDRLEQRHDWSCRDVLQRRGPLWHCFGDPRAVSYPAAFAYELARVEDTSAWFRHRNRSIARVVRTIGLAGILWEVGAGNGIVAADLAAEGFGVIAVEPDSNAAAVSAGRGVPTIVGFLDSLRLPGRSIDAVGLFDVLEHVERPAELLAEVARVLAPGGKLFVAVPAYPWLWSPEDEAAGHYRRYTARSLTAEVVRSGLRPAHGEYIFHSLVPAVFVGRVLFDRLRRRRGGALHRTVTQLDPRSATTARVMRMMFGAEAAVDARFSPPFGTSIVAVFVQR